MQLFWSRKGIHIVSIIAVQSGHHCQPNFRPSLQYVTLSNAMIHNQKNWGVTKGSLKYNCISSNRRTCKQTCNYNVPIGWNISSLGKGLSNCQWNFQEKRNDEWTSRLAMRGQASNNSRFELFTATNQPSFSSPPFVSFNSNSNECRAIPNCTWTTDRWIEYNLQYIHEYLYHH